MSRLLKYLSRDDNDIMVVLWLCVAFLAAFFVYAPFHIAGKI